MFGIDLGLLIGGVSAVIAFIVGLRWTAYNKGHSDAEHEMNENMRKKIDEANRNAAAYRSDGLDERLRNGRF